MDMLTEIASSRQSIWSRSRAGAFLLFVGTTSTLSPLRTVGKTPDSTRSANDRIELDCPSLGRCLMTCPCPAQALGVEDIGI